MAAPRKHFHEQLRDLREGAQQTPDIMAVLLNLAPDEYQAMESGQAYPDNETLKRLCMIADWNYYDVQRLIINDMSVPASPPSGTQLSGSQPPAPGDSGGDPLGRTLQGFPLKKSSGLTQRPDTLGNRLKDVRRSTGQSVDIIAMLLNIGSDEYRRMEAGEAPSDELLRHISIIYDWNFYDLRTLLRTEQAQALQPRRMGNPFPGTFAKTGQIKTVLTELERLFQGIPEKEQDFVLSQLELVRNTMIGMQQAS